MFRILFATLAVLLIPAVAIAQFWTPLASGTVNPLDDVWFTDAQNGWVVGNAGLSRVTQDGGQSWAAFFLTNGDLSDVEFTGTQIGLVVGDNGLIFRTANAGLSWAGAASGTGSNLRTVCFSGTGPAYAAGRDGAITRSADDGATWSLVENGVDRYRDSDAVGDSAWIVGDGGVIRATTDGGANWFNQTSGTGNDLHAVFFLNAQEGWVGGQNNTLLYTANGGTSWTSRNAGILVGPNAIHFVDANDGWVVSDAGTIYHTANGGLLWATETSGTTNTLSDVHFVSPGLGWSVGDLGTILIRDLVTDAPWIATSSFEVNVSPNPLRDATTFSFVLQQPSLVELTIFDAAGRVVRRHREAFDDARAGSLRWDGKDLSGAAAPSGVYFYRLTTDAGQVSGKVTVLR